MADRKLVTDAPLKAFLADDELVQRDHPEIRAFTAERIAGCDEIEAARRVFHFIRDDVAHSWDVQSKRVTRSASDVLLYREGICYAKSHLAAAMLRSVGIPSGICYQRLTLFDDDSGGYAVHALNTVWFEGLRRWIRFDARGNKPGINAQFSIDEELLAFSVRSQYDELDYLRNHATPHPRIVSTLMNNEDALLMYRERLPATLE